MESPEAIVHSQAKLGRGEETADCGGPPTEVRWHPVADATTTSNEKEAKKTSVQDKAPKSENHSNGQPLIEDRGLMELLELQKRMFERT